MDSYMVTDVCPTTQGPHEWVEQTRLVRKHGGTIVFYKCSRCGQDWLKLER